MNTLLRDLNYAARQLLRTPLFTVLAVLSFGLGIGANTTLYIWAKALLFDPFPAASESGRLVSMNITDKNQGFISVSYPDYRDIKDRTKALDGLVAFRPTTIGLGGGERPVRAFAEMVSGNYFDVLGIPMAQGRGFMRSEDEKPLQSPVLVLGYDLWQREFGGDPAVVGRSLAVNSRAFTVVGVAGEGFYGASAGMAYEAWVPMMMQEWVDPNGSAGRLEQRGNSFLRVLGRLAPGMSLARAQAELSTIGQALVREYPENANPGKGIAIAPLWRAPQTAAEVMGPVLAVLGGVTVLVLLIAAMNVASLLLARALGRRREIAVRTALGASRGRIVRQLLAESLLLSVLGSLAGAGVAYFGATLLGRMLPENDFPLRVGALVDGPALAVAIALGVLTGVVFGLVPALQTSRPDSATVMREESGSVAGASGRSRWFRRLVMGQLAASTVMLIIAGLFLRSLDRASNFDVGFEPKGVLISSLELFTSGYDAERGHVFFNNLVEEASTLPGVSSVALARRVPLGFGGSSSTSFDVEGYEPPKGSNAFGFFNVVTPSYFDLMRTPLIRGREFAQTDLDTAPRVAVINETMASRYWPGKDAIGGRFRIGPDWVTVVGVAKDATYRDLGERKAPWFFLPLAQRYRADITVLLRGSGDPRSLSEPLRRLVSRLDPNLPLFATRTLEEHIRAAAVRQSVGGRLLSLLGALGLVLAAVGLFGTLAFGVAQRTREMGVRLAVGGIRADIVRMIVGEGLRLTAIGVAVGLVFATGAAQLMKGLLLGVRPWDPATLSVVLLVLGISSLVACLVPAWRAAGTDPVTALRAE
ncbi:MAG: ABC transporter permease [Vicinamibacteria bacterium]|nr:ABC transporter permease [Vicinamibacteria bacterium]